MKLETYTANGSCQCEAFKHEQPCYRRAMTRLYQRYTQAQTRTAKRATYEEACRQMDELYA